MDFGDILDQWERERRESFSKNSGGEAARPPADPPAEKRPADGLPAKRPAKRSAKPSAYGRAAFEAWIAAQGVHDKDSQEEEDPEASRAARARRLAAMRPQAVLDLHGMCAEAAEDALSGFFEESARAGLEKVLVIHGKGMHSEGEPVLGRTARRVIEASPWTGGYGPAERSQGGSGALWVAVKRGSNRGSG